VVQAQQSYTIYSNTPRSHNSATTDVETGSKLLKHRGRETLREHVGELRCRRDMEDADLTDGDLFSDEVKIISTFLVRWC
jgi:hypothetical protein